MTEKNYNPQQKDSKTSSKQARVSSANMDERMKKQQNASPKVEQPMEKIETKKHEVKTEDKKIEKKQVQKVKKTEAVFNGISLPISTKDSVAICKFIRGKSIDRALIDLEQVLNFKKAIPIMGNIPHRKGKGMMSGRYMTKPVEHFIRMLKDLKANSNVNGLDEPIIVEAIPNRASQPYGRFGAVKRKRTHVKIKAVERSKLMGGKK